MRGHLWEPWPQVGVGKEMEMGQHHSPHPHLLEPRLSAKTYGKGIVICTDGARDPASPFVPASVGLAGSGESVPTVGHR